MNLVEKWVTIARQCTDAPQEFLYASAYWVVSAILGKYVYTIGADGNPFKPNLYVILCGPAGLTRKSTVINYAWQTYKKVLREHYKAEGKPPEGIDEIILAKRIEEFTIEGVCDHIDATKQNDYVIISPEMGLFLMRSNIKYMTGVLNILSKLYYGEGHIQALSQRGGKKGYRYIPEGLYVTMIGGMQDFRLYITPEMFTQGIVRRVLFVYKDKGELRPPFQQNNIFDLDEILPHFVDRLQIVKDCETITPVRKVLSEIDSMYTNDVKNIDTKNPLASYIEGKWHFLLKLSLLEALADCDNKPRGGDVVVTYEHFLRAKNFFDTSFQNILSLLEEATIPSQEAKITKSERIVARLRKCIESERCISLGKLMEKMAMTKKEIIPYLETLLEEDGYTVFAVKKPNTKPSIYIGLKGCESNFIKAGFEVYPATL